MRKLFTFLLAALLAVTAYAGSISRGGGSFSRSVSSASTARSIGMSRPSVSKPSSTSNYASTSRPSYKPSYTPPRPTTSPQYAPAPSYSSGGSGGGFLSSMAGGFTGSALGSMLFGNHGSGTTVVNNGGGGVAPAVGGAAMAGAPVAYAAPVTVSSGPTMAGLLGNILLCLFLLCLIGALIWFVWGVIKTARQRAAEVEMDPEELPFSPIAKFIAIQQAFAARDTMALHVLLGPDMVDQAVADLPDEPSEYTLANIAYHVVDVSPFTISVHFTADDKSDNTTLNEMWHFRRIGSSWVLNGIEQ